MAVYQCCPSRLNHCSVPNSSPHYLSEAKLSGFAALRVESISALTSTLRSRAWHAGRVRLPPSALRESMMPSTCLRA